MFKILNLAYSNLKYHFIKIFLVYLNMFLISLLILTSFTFFFTLKNNVINKYLDKLPVNEIIVSKKNYNFNLPIIKNLNFSSKKNITDNTILTFKKNKEVKNIYPMMNLNFPVSIIINLFGYTYTSDLSLIGVDEKILEYDKIKTIKPFTYNSKKNKYIPALISYQLIDLYNSNFAKTNSLPELSYKAVLGRHFTLIFGKSSLSSSNKIKKIKCEIVGLTNRTALLGLSIPLKTIKELNKWNLEKNYKNYYSSLIVTVNKTSNVDILEKKIQKAGFKTFSFNSLILKVNITIKILLFIISIIIIFLLIVTLSNIFNYFVMLLESQKEDIKILYLAGLSKIQIKKIYLYQSLIITFIIQMITLVIYFIFMHIINIKISELLLYFELNIKNFIIISKSFILIESLIIILIPFTIIKFLKKL